MVDMNPIVWCLIDLWSYLVETLFWPFNSYKQYRMYRKKKDYVRKGIFRDRVLVGLFAISLMVFGVCMRQDQMLPTAYLGLIFYWIGMMTEADAAVVYIRRKPS